jgi:hypothetical protein
MAWARATTTERTAAGEKRPVRRDSARETAAMRENAFLAIRSSANGQDAQGRGSEPEAPEGRF